MLGRWWQSKNSPFWHHRQPRERQSERVLGLSPTPGASWLQLLCFCPGDQQHLPHCPSVVPQRTEEVVCPLAKSRACGRTHGEKPIRPGPSHLTAKGQWSQGQREERCFLTSSRLPFCRLSRRVPYALEQPVAWNLWDLVVNSLGYPSPFSPWYLCWQEHKINTPASLVDESWEGDTTE